MFTAFGLVLGPLGLGFLHLDIDAEAMRTLAELTLALVLFTDASNANLAVLKKSFHIPQRLLLLGLPLTIILGFAARPHADGQAYPAGDRHPGRDAGPHRRSPGQGSGFRPRRARSHARGPKCGERSQRRHLRAHIIRLPGHGHRCQRGPERFNPGAQVGGRGDRHRRRRRDWRNPLGRLGSAPGGSPGLVDRCLAATPSDHHGHILFSPWPRPWGAAGFIASFVGGLLFGYLVKRHKHQVLLAAEGVGDTFALITWVAFGSAVVGQSFKYLSWEVVLYSVLSLTVVRMLPVFLVLGGMKLRTDEKLFMGWFGPRGLASVVFAVIVLDSHLPGGSIIGVTAVCTITLSIIAHGLSANPLVAKLSKRLGAFNQDTP